jgi:hypothetical protein
MRTLALLACLSVAACEGSGGMDATSAAYLGALMLGGAANSYSAAPQYVPTYTPFVTTRCLPFGGVVTCHSY